MINRRIVNVNEMPLEDQICIIDMVHQHEKKKTFKQWFSLQNDFQWIGQGENAFVYSYKDYAIKIQRDDKSHSVVDDYYILGKLQGYSYFPKLYFYEKLSFMVVELKSGRVLENIENTMDFSRRGKLDCKYIEKQANECVKIIYKAGLSPNDMHGKNIIINEDNSELYIIDVGNFYDYPDYDSCDVGWLKYDLIDRVRKYNRQIDDFQTRQLANSSKILKSLQQVM